MDEKSKDAWRIFVLADTHNRLPESVTEMAKDADEIWHLGDVCAETILDELRGDWTPSDRCARKLRQQFRVAVGSRPCARRVEIPPATRSAGSTAG